MNRAASRLSRLLGLLPLALLLTGAVAMLAPFVWMFATSMQTPLTAYDLPPHWLPLPLRTQNYADALTGPVSLMTALFNSTVIAILVTVGQLITCPMAGYAFARLRFPGRGALLVTLLASLMVPVQVTVIPLFLLMRGLHLVDNPASLILPGLTGAFGVFLMRQFFLTLPAEILEAARVDGASPWTVYRRVALPLAKPSLAALAIITFLGTWNAYFLPSIFLNSVNHATMPLALVLMLGPYKTGNVAMIMAATTMAIVPAFAVFLFAQKWIVSSLTQSGVKG